MKESSKELIIKELEIEGQYNYLKRLTNYKKGNLYSKILGPKTEQDGSSWFHIVEFNTENPYYKKLIQKINCRHVKKVIYVSKKKGC